VSEIDVTAFDVLTFDCYGTLIDWERGILDALQPILAAHGETSTDDEVLELYGRLEAAVEAGPYLKYREVLGRVLQRMGEDRDFSPTRSQLEEFSASVGDWPAFPDVPAALRALGQRFQLGVISNIDDDLFAASEAKLGRRVDWVVTAEQVGAYKPSRRNFLLGIQRSGVPRERILHVAQSKFHDIVPAKELGLATVWVNRRRGKTGSGATPAAEVTADWEVVDLRELAERISETR